MKIGQTNQDLYYLPSLISSCLIDWIVLCTSGLPTPNEEAGCVVEADRLTPALPGQRENRSQATTQPRNFPTILPNHQLFPPTTHQQYLHPRPLTPAYYHSSSLRPESAVGLNVISLPVKQQRYGSFFLRPLPPFYSERTACCQATVNSRLKFPPQQTNPPTITRVDPELFSAPLQLPPQHDVWQLMLCWGLKFFHSLSRPFRH